MGRSYLGRFAPGTCVASAHKDICDHLDRKGRRSMLRRHALDSVVKKVPRHESWADIRYRCLYDLARKLWAARLADPAYRSFFAPRLLPWPVAQCYRSGAFRIDA